jgi:hypothetical protein
MAILSKGQTFASTDTVTSTKLNNLVDNAAFVSGSSGTTDDSSLEVNGSGRLQVKDSGISSAKIAASAITTAKLATATGATDGVTYAKIQHVANMRVIGNTSGSLAAPSEVSILDEDDMVSDSATAVATQQSIKAYTETYVASRYVLDTVKASTSGTSIDFTGIPSWVKRITVMLGEISTNGTAAYRVRLGTSGGFETTGYISTATDSSGNNSATDGFLVIRANSASALCSGVVVISKLTGNKWVYEGSVVSSGTNQTSSSAGYKSLGGVLTQISVLTNGTDTFDAGEINISYE